MSQGKSRLRRPRRSLASTLPERIRYFRLRAGLTGVTLCARLGVTSGALSRWEHGSNTPSLEMIERIAHECGIDPVRLLRSKDALPSRRRNGNKRAA